LLPHHRKPRRFIARAQRRSTSVLDQSAIHVPFGSGARPDNM
jgi:hypothetical protein